jgi:hypothetical protein
VLDCGINTGSGRVITWTRSDLTKVSNVRTLSVSAAGTYKVRIDSGGVCADSQTVFVSSTMPTVNIGKDTSLCNPSTLTVTSSVKDPLFTYKWQKDGNLLPNTGFSLVVSQPGRYRLGISTNSCPEQFDELVVTSSLPVVEDQAICGNTKATFTITSTGNSFSWYADSTTATVLATGNTYTTPTLTQTTKYYVATNTTGTSPTCSGVADWSSSTIYERATSSQVISVKYNGFLYTLNSAVWWSKGNAPDVSTFYWTKGAACAVVCARTPVVANVSVCTGLEETDIFDDVKVYPNPFFDKIHVTIINFESEVSNLKLIGLDGAEIQTMSEKVATNKYVINTTDLPKGLYLLRIESAGKVRILKVSK